MERKFDPANAARVKREAISKRKLEAEETCDAEEVIRCEAELASLGNSLSGGPAIKSKPLPGKNGALARQESLAALNAKNRGKNAEAVRNALLEERKKLQAAREQATREAGRGCRGGQGQARRRETPPCAPEERHERPFRRRVGCESGRYAWGQWHAQTIARWHAA